MTMRRLLAIDDDEGFATLVRTVAEGQGLDAVVTGKADEFKAEYHRAMPDVIVLDIVMPEVDGIELMEWLAEEGYGGSVVIVSGYDPTYARAAKSLAESRSGMRVQTLGKPVKLADLRAAITGAAKAVTGTAETGFSDAPGQTG